MSTAQTVLNVTTAEFVDDPFVTYNELLNGPSVVPVKIMGMKLYGVVGYDNCAAVLKDPRFLRNRTRATGGGRRAPFPVPNSIKLLMESMIQEDDPDHRRLRDLVRHAFRPQAIQQLADQIDVYSHELLDELAGRDSFNLQKDYALPIPVRMIAGMLGVEKESQPVLQQLIDTLSEGMSGIRAVKTVLFNLPRSVKAVRGMIQAKRKNPGDDILTSLIEADENGDRLTEDELIAMVFLLIIAGFETTVHLITNGTVALLDHPDELAKFRAEPDIAGSAVEEIVRYYGPVHGTKPGYATEDIEIDGVVIPKGKPVIPLFGTANRDPRVFADPNVFDVTRTPNRHLGFGHGVHFCLGAHLARLETQIALTNLFERLPQVQLAVPRNQLKHVRMPFWFRFDGLPVLPGGNRTAAAA